MKLPIRMNRNRWIVAGSTALVLIVILGLHLNFNRLLRQSVQRHASESLGVPCDIGGAGVGLFGGSASLNDVRIAPPRDYKTQPMLSIARIDARVSAGQLGSDPVNVSLLTIRSPVLVVEQKGLQLNFQRLLVSGPKAPAGDKPGDGERQDGEPLRLKIAKAVVRDATITLKVGIPGVKRQDVTVEIPELELTKLSAHKDAANGATLREVCTQLATAILAKALETGRIPHDARVALAQSVSEAARFVGGEFAVEIQSISKPLGTLIKDVAPPTAKPDIDSQVKDVDIDAR